MCVKPNPCGLIAHTNMIKELPAIYPYMNSTLAVASISKGEYGHSENNLFQGEIPSQLILTLMESNSFGGLYKKNPFSSNRSTVISCLYTLTNNRILQSLYNRPLLITITWKPIEISKLVETISTFHYWNLRVDSPSLYLT